MDGNTQEHLLVDDAIIDEDDKHARNRLPEPSSAPTQECLVHRKVG
jgi:hypothetical protein